jgi:predicted kinase
MVKLILVRGLPGSGKSTLASQLRNFAHLEADMYFIDEHGEYRFDASKLSRAHQWCQQQTFAYLKASFPVVVSNTFTTQKELQPYLDMASELGITPQVVLCQGEFGSVHNVPEETLLKMKQRFQYDIKI